MKIEVFRGQYGLFVAEIQTRLPSISFGSLKAASLYATKPNNRADIIVKPIILSAVIQILNPIINNTSDCFADFDLLIEKLGSDFMWYIAEKYAEHIYNTDNWQNNYSEYGCISTLKSLKPEELGNLYVDAYVFLDDEEFINHSMKLGFDGAIHIGNGQTYNELEYRIFSEKQILDVFEVAI